MHTSINREINPSSHVYMHVYLYIQFCKYLELVLALNSDYCIYFCLYHFIFCMSSSPKPIQTNGYPPELMSAQGFFPTGEFFSHHCKIMPATVQINFKTPLNVMQRFIQHSWLIANVHSWWRILFVDNQILKQLKQIRISSWWPRVYHNDKLFCS